MSRTHLMDLAAKILAGVGMTELVDAMTATVVSQKCDVRGERLAI